MDTYKILGQSCPATLDTLVELYTVPVRSATSYTIDGSAAEVTPSSVDQNIQTTITSITVCKISGTPTFTIVLFPPDASITDLSTTLSGTPEYFLFLDNTALVATNETQVISPGLTLPAGSSLYVATDVDGGVSFTAMGIETK